MLICDLFYEHVHLHGSLHVRYKINVDITDQLVVSCDLLYYTIPVTDGDTAPSSSQASSATPQGAVKTSSPVVGKW